METETDLTEFELAFGSAAETDAEASDTTEKETVDATAEEVVAEDTVSSEEAAEETPEEVVDAEAKVEKPEKVEVPEQPKVDEAALAAAKAKQDEEAKAAKEAEDKRAADAAAKEQLTAEEQEIISHVAADFPETAQALKIFERVVMTKAQNFVASELKRLKEEFSSQLAPALTVAQSYARNAHEHEILGKHSDAFTLLPEVEKWVESKPNILKNAYNAVLDNGTAKEIIELYDVFKSEKKGSAQPSRSEADNAAAKAKAEADALEREKKLKAQEGVRSRQTAQKSSSVDEDDFEGAFQLAANM